MVSTLHITLSYNMPPAHAIGRSASCEDANRIGLVASAGGFPAKTTSFSTSNVAEAKRFFGGSKPISSSRISSTTTGPGGYPLRNSSHSTSNVPSVTSAEVFSTQTNSFSSSNLPSVTVPGGIGNRATSLSSSDIPVCTVGNRPLSRSSNFLLAPTPYTPSSGALRSPSWSPVRFNPSKPSAAQGTSGPAASAKPGVATSNETKWLSQTASQVKTPAPAQPAASSPAPTKAKGQSQATTSAKTWAKTRGQSQAAAQASSNEAPAVPPWVRVRKNQVTLPSTTWVKSRPQSQATPVASEATTQGAKHVPAQVPTAATAQPTIQALNWATTRGKNKAKTPTSPQGPAEAAKPETTQTSRETQAEARSQTVSEETASNDPAPRRSRPQVKTIVRRGLARTGAPPTTTESSGTSATTPGTPTTAASAGAPPLRRTTSSSRSPLRSPSRTPGTSPSSGAVPDWAINSSPPSSSVSPWRVEPKRLRPSSFSRIEDSVHSGRGSKGVVGGGVMEDGTSHAHVAARVVAASSAAHRKAQSLPGHYSRPQHLQHTPPPQSFRDAFTTSKSPTPPAVSPGTARHNATQGLAPAAPPRGPTSPRATRVASTSSIGSQQYQHQQQQRQHLQQRLLQQEQNMQQAQQQKLQQQQQQRLEQQHLQQRLEQQHLQQKMQGQHEQRQKESEPAERQAPMQEKKSKRSLLSGIFRRRKKGMAESSSSSSSSSSDSEEPQKRHFLRRKSKKKEPKEREPLPPPPPPPPAPEDYSPVARSAGSVRVTPLDGSGGSSSLGCENSFMSTDGRRIVRVTPAGVMSTSRGMDIQPLGIPVSLAQQGRRGVSASHDSLPVSLGSWAGGGSHASLGYCSGGGMGARSSSTDTISKKERREALKARVERLRDKFKDSSSDEEKASVSSHSMYGSESSLSKTNSLSKRSRAARTERFLRRKSQELETLRTETEKDRRNREVVQARIQEIQRVREYEAERNRINEEKKKEAEKAHKPRWSAKLVYQESSEYESSVVLRTPSVSPAASPHMKAKFQGHIPRQPSETREAVVMRNKPQSVAVSLAPPSGLHLRRSFQDYETPLQGDLRSHRSASYDSNINRSSFIMQSPGMSPVSGNRSGLTPPVPPPRDPSRIMSPADGRPMSFSFESLNQDPNRPNSSQSSLSNFTKGSSPSPSVRSVPAYLGPKPNGPQVGPPPLVTAPTRRSFSELQLSPQQQSQLKYNTGGAPARPSPPGYPNTQYRYTDQPPRPTTQNQYYRAQQQQHYAQPVQLQHTQSQPQVVQSQQNNQLKYYTDQSPQYAKIVPISSVPPSPSSDYSSYMSDNSARLQQVNTAWRQKEQEIKNKRNLPSQVLSDSSRSNSPKGIDGNNSNNSISLGVDQQAEETYGSILPKKARPPPITLKQAESLSSLSGQSDVSSPVPKGPDSDSSQSSLARDKKTVAQNRPLSMVLEKSESAEKDSPPVTPKTQPQPPRRGHRQLAASDLSATKQQILHNIIKHKREHPQDKPKYQKEFEEMYRKEKERLEKSKCSNFEEALKELEEIYDSLKLDSDDILDRAERRDLPTVHQQLRSNKDGQDTLNDSTSEATETDSTVKDRSSRPRTPRMRRSGVPDKKSDDMHFRRCQQSSRNQPDVQKALQMTGSYLLVSPAHTTPSDVDKNVPKDPMLEGEPDIVYDDVSYRNIKQANAIKIIDPQPPFGIPLGPTTQSSPSDYLHVSRKDNYRPKMIARKQPDTTMDDLAFRNLRKEQRDRELNTSELDELLSEANTDSPVHRRRAMRSMSADRARAMQHEHNLQHAHEVLGASASKDRGGKLQTPRRVKHQQEARRAGRFFESYKDAIGDSESGLTSPRHNPSWLERANLTDNKWENLSTSNLSNLSTSTETLTEMSSARAVSQPDIRQAIIREARVPPGGPSTWLEAKRKCAEASFTSDTPTITTITAPKLVKIQTIQSSPVSPVVVERKPYRPLDSIFNNKPKPFYLADPKPTEQQQKQDHVDIAHLDALISTLSKIETNEETTTPSTPPATSPLTEKNVDNVKPDVVCDSDIYAKPDTISKPDTSTPLKISEEPVYENVFEPQQSVNESTEPVEKICAKANIEKAIRLSMALESSNSEGKEVSTRRRSAIELPLRDAQPPYSSLSSNISSTNDNCLNVNLYSSRVPGPCSPERVTLLGEEDLSQGPAKVATCKDRVEAMIVTSECVHERARRAHSVPASPKVVEEHAPVFDKVFEVATRRVSRQPRVVDEAVVVASECSSRSLSITQPQWSTAKENSQEDPSSAPESPQSFLPPESDESESKQQSMQQLQSQPLLSACDIVSLSETPGDDSLPRHAATAILLQSEHVLQHDVDGQASHKGSASRLPPLEAPPPPVRSSSLPPSPVRSRAPNFALHLSGPSSPMRTRTAAVDMPSPVRQHCLRGHVARGSSVPVQGRRSSTSSEEGEEGRSSMLVRAGSLPPTSRPPSTRGAPAGDSKTTRNPAPPGPRSCSSGEGLACHTSASDPSECAWGQSLVAACYLLACITQMAGLDIFTAIGLMLAMASVFATFAL
nr:serine/arginine repetitive matrix protein 2-like [Penaeus vannamei]